MPPKKSSFAAVGGVRPAGEHDAALKERERRLNALKEGKPLPPPMVASSNGAHAEDTNRTRLAPDAVYKVPRMMANPMKRQREASPWMSGAPKKRKEDPLLPAKRRKV